MMSTSAPNTAVARSSDGDGARARHGDAGVVAQYIQDLARAQASA